MASELNSWHPVGIASHEVMTMRMIAAMTVMNRTGRFSESAGEVARSVCDAAK